MIIYRLKSKLVIYDLYLPKKSNGKVVLYVPGLPGHPRRERLANAFARHGFTFFEMRYPGSWESDGKFTMNNCVKSLEEAYDFIKKGVGTELRRNARKKWATNEIILLGASFGGGVVLSSRIKAPLTFVLLAPLTKLEYAKSSLMRLPSGEDDLYYLLRRGYGNVYRHLKLTDWNNLLAGRTLIDPIKNLTNLRDKKMLFFQGDKDKVIKKEDTASFVQELKGQRPNGQKLNALDARLFLVPGAAHGRDLEEKAARHIIKALS